MIQVIRSVLAVLLGYVVFAASAFAIFRLSGQAPHAEASVAFMCVTIVSGIVTALLGGYIAAMLAGRNPQAHGAAVGVVLAIGAAVSLAATIGHGAVWTQVAALLLMAPAAAFGGWLRARTAAH